MTMRPHYLTLDAADEDTDGFANDVTAAAGEAFDLAATAPTDGLAHKVIITPGGSVTGNYTITGLDPDGQAISETLATDTTNAVTSTSYFSELTAVLAPSGIGSETVDIGWVDEISSPTIPLEFYTHQGPPSVQVTVTGTINFDVQVTNSDLRASYSPPPAQGDFTWLVDTNFDGKTASLIDTLANVVRACRVLVNSYSSGAALEVAIISPM